MKKIVFIITFLISFSIYSQGAFTGGTNVPTGFGLQDPQPLDDRVVVAEFNDLDNVHDTFLGIIIAQTKDSTAYLKTNNGWREFAFKDQLVNAYSDEQAQDAIGTIISDDGNIMVVYDDSSPSLSFSLSSSILTSIALANTSLQSGDNISTLNNDAGYITADDIPESSGIVESVTTDFTITDGRLAYNRYNATDVYYITPSDSVLLTPSQPNGYNQVNAVYMNGLLLNEYEDYYVNSETEIELLTKIPNTRNTIQVKYTTLTN